MSKTQPAIGQSKPREHLQTQKQSQKQSPKPKNYHCQYSILENSKYIPTTTTVNALLGGYYESGNSNNFGIFLNKLPFSIEELIRFENTIADEIINEFVDFWTKKEAYTARGEHHKRGYLLWGPPGGGKSCTVSFIMNDFIKAGNVVFKFNEFLLHAIPLFREIEPDRKIMIIMEDIDGLIKNENLEQEILQFLDGGIQQNDTIVIATTNYPELLPDRIINRPSRFDRVEEIGMPNEAQRLKYIKIKSMVDKKDLDKWVNDTENYTLAHIKELIISTEVLGLKYDDVIARLNLMRENISNSQDYEKEMRGINKSKLGFGV